MIKHHSYIWGFGAFTLLLYSLFFYEMQFQHNLWKPAHIPKVNSSIHFAFFTWGSRGDVQPFIELGKVLIERGHKVTITLRAKYAALGTKNGFNVHLMPEDGTEDLMKNLLGAKSNLNAALILNNYWGSQYEIWNNRWKEIPNVQAVVASTYVHLAAIKYSYEKGIPVFFLNFIPSFSTVDFADFYVTEGLMKDFGQPFVNWLSYLPSQLLQGFLVKWDDPKAILGYSRSYWGTFPQFFVHHLPLFPVPSDIPDWFHYLGSLNLVSQSYDETSEVSAYVGLGSMEGYNLTRFSTIVGQIFRNRPIYLYLFANTINASIIEQFIPASRFTIQEEYDHSTLFSRVDLIIHHGGAGHTSMASMAGKPQIIIPFFPEQYIWGKRLTELGAARIMPMHEIEAGDENTAIEKLSEIVDRTINNLEMKSNAKRLTLLGKSSAQYVAETIFGYFNAWLGKPSTTKK